MPRLTGRNAAFQQPIDEGWSPRPGERVFLSRSFSVKTGVVKFLDGDQGRVLFRVGRRYRDGAIRRGDLRPLSVWQKKIWSRMKTHKR